MIKIAVDAMGGDNSPKKVIDGIIHHHLTIRIFFIKYLVDENKLNEIDNKIDNNNFEILIL